MRPSAAVITCGLLGALQVLTVSGCASGTYPQISEDGLILVPQGQADALYIQPGVDLRSYRKLLVEECTVAFRDNWQSDQNQDRAPARRVTDEDMIHIARTLATSCHQILVDELGKIEGGDVVTDGGAGTLVFLTSMLDLDIAAPDVQAGGRHRAYTTSVGTVSFHLELVDSDTGAVVGRMIDRGVAAETFSLQWTTRLGNIVEFDRILRRWASQVRERIQPGAE